MYVAVFCRNFGLKFQGRCVMLMKSAEDARQVVEYGNRRTVGGNTIKVSYVSYIFFLFLKNRVC